MVTAQRCGGPFWLQPLQCYGDGVKGMGQDASAGGLTMPPRELWSQGSPRAPSEGLQPCGCERSTVHTDQE